MTDGRRTGGTAGGRPLGIASARFVASVSRPGEVPAALPEFAMTGRSNVGKSSLINALCQQRQLARTSRTPGRTQRIQLFDVRLDSGDELRLVDLPGFGHAVAPGAVRDEFSPMIQGYLLGQPLLRAVIVLIDSRREADPDAIGFVEWLRGNGLHPLLVVTKIDKVPKNQQFSTLARLRKDYGLEDAPLAVSVLDGSGIAELRALLRNLANPLRRTRRPGSA